MIIMEKKYNCSFYSWFLLTFRKHNNKIRNYPNHGWKKGNIDNRADNIIKTINSVILLLGCLNSIKNLPPFDSGSVVSYRTTWADYKRRGPVTNGGPPVKN